MNWSVTGVPGGIGSAARTAPAVSRSPAPAARRETCIFIMLFSSEFSVWVYGCGMRSDRLRITTPDTRFEKQQPDQAVPGEFPSHTHTHTGSSTHPHTHTHTPTHPHTFSRPSPRSIMGLRRMTLHHE